MNTISILPAPSRPPQRRVPLAKPFWSYALIAFTAFIYLLQITLGDSFTYAYGLKVNEYIHLGQYWRLITPIFFHASLMHILFNMYALYNIGPELERTFGPVRFLLLYFLSGYAGVLASFVLSPNPSLGASGAIFGLIGALAVFLYRNREFLGPVGRNMLANVLFIIVLNVFLSFSGGIDLWGHFGGLLTGAILALLIGPVWAREEDPVSGMPWIVDQQPLGRQWPLLAGFIASLLVLSIWLVVG